jgi:hypothetical protein
MRNWIARWLGLRQIADHQQWMEDELTRQQTNIKILESELAVERRLAKLEHKVLALQQPAGPIQLKPVQTQPKRPAKPAFEQPT